MAGATARGRALLAAPISFCPKPQPSFPVQHCAVSFSAGFIIAFAIFITWLFNLD